MSERWRRKRTGGTRELHSDLQAHRWAAGSPSNRVSQGTPLLACLGVQQAHGSPERAAVAGSLPPRPVILIHQPERAGQSHAPSLISGVASKGGRA